MDFILLVAFLAGAQFKGVRLLTDLEEAVTRGEVLKDQKAANASVFKIVRWLRAIWTRRRRWARNAVVADSKRDAALKIQRVARGMLGRWASVIVTCIACFCQADAPSVLECLACQHLKMIDDWWSIVCDGCRRL